MAKAPEEQKAAQDPKKTGGKKGLLLVGAVLVIVLGAGAGAFLILSKTPADPLAVAPSEASSQVPPRMFPLSDFIVNLAPPDTDVFLRVSITLAIPNGNEETSEKVTEELGNRKAQIKDMINGVLSSKRKSDVETSMGKDSLKKEIVRRINEVVTLGDVEDAYFEEFTFQTM